MEYDVWTHWALVVDGTNSRAHYYKNGVLESTNIGAPGVSTVSRD